MTDLAKNLADAAREVAVMVRKTASDELQPRHYFGELHYILTDDLFALSEALAAFDAAQVSPSDAEIEAAIDAFGQAVFESGKADGKPRWATDVIAKNDEVSRHHRSLLAIMRRAHPDAGLLRAASNALRCVEWNAGMWGEPPQPCVRLSRAAFDDLRAEVARLEKP